MSLCIEAGKPIQDARGEVTRLIDTFRIAAEEAPRIARRGAAARHHRRARAATPGMWKRVPIGPCSFISPFNFPLNLAAHKIAPALAVGLPVRAQAGEPARPIGALIIGEVLAETDLPRGAFSILPVPARRRGPVHHRRAPEAAELHRLARGGLGPQGARRARRRWCSSSAATRRSIVDETGADLADAVERIVFGAFYQSGQSCIGVQRILVHEAVYDELRERLVDRHARARHGRSEGRARPSSGR